MPYLLATVHPLQTDNRRTTTMTTVRPLLKYGRQKMISRWSVAYFSNRLTKLGYYRIVITLTAFYII